MVWTRFSEQALSDIASHDSEYVERVIKGDTLVISAEAKEWNEGMAKEMETDASDSI